MMSSQIRHFGKSAEKRRLVGFGSKAKKKRREIRRAFFRSQIETLEERRLLTSDVPVIDSLPDAQTGTETVDAAAALDDATIDRFAAHGVEYWRDVGASEAQLDVLSAATYSVADLGSNRLGAAENLIVTLDDNAAGQEWFVDSSPGDSIEFQRHTAKSPRGIDLLSVMIHEQGHWLGLEDVYAGNQQDDVMYGLFEAGERRLAEFGQAEGAVAGSLEGVHYAIILNGAPQSDPLTTSGVQTVNGVNTIDGGSLWTHNDDLLKIGNRTTGSLTVSGGGWLEVTAPSVPDTYAFQVGNQGGGIAHALVTGTGSKVTTLTPIQVGRNESGSTLTIEDGGLVVGQDVVLGRQSGSGFLRMGAGGVLAIEGAGKTLLSQMHTVQGGGEMQYNPSGDGTTWVNITGATGGGVDYTLANGTGALAGYTVLVIVPPNTAPVANDDTNSATEAGGVANATTAVGGDTTTASGTSGNVMGGTGVTAGDVADTDVDADDNPTAGDGSVVVSNIAFTGTPFQATNAGGAVTGATQIDGTYGTLTIHPDGSYSYALDATASDPLDTGDTPTEECTYTIADSTEADTATLTITVNGTNDAPADAIPPEVLTTKLNSDQTDPTDPAQPTTWAEQRSSIASIVVTFSEPMTMDVDDLRLTNLGVNAPQVTDEEFDLQPSHFDLNDNNDVLTLSFSPGELDDGVYRIEVLQTATDLAGNALDGDSNVAGSDDYLLQGDTDNKFYQLQAEWSGDEGVSVFDFTTFSYWFGSSTIIEPVAPQYVDLNNDDGVSVFDFTGFSNNFGTGIVYQTGFAGVVILSVEANITVDEREAIEQVVEIAATEDAWGIAARERIVDDMNVEHQRESLGELDLELESLIDALANDLARSW
jgi:VCBS repeat-containing protein/T5SS/PEP-CTERM-associated repeat protein